MPKSNGHSDEKVLSTGHLMVDFDAPDSTQFKFDYAGITPMQLIAMGEYFAAYGRQLLREQVLKEKV